MTIRLRTLFFIILALVAVWFFYVERAILTPFVLAAIFAYIFNPIINFFSRKIKLPRSLSIIVVYLFIVALFIFIATLLTRRIVEESLYFGNNFNLLKQTTIAQINLLPQFVRPAFQEALLSFESIQFYPSASIIKIFPEAFSKILNVFVFLFAGFYFLKEGRGMFDKLLNFVPNDYKIEMEILLHKMNAVLAGYLRGQIILIAIMIFMLFVSLSILGVKFALILAIFSGIAEIIPIVGPIFAGAIGALVVFLSGTSSFGLNSTQVALVTIVIYFVTRQIQDYFFALHIMGKIVKIHPFLIFFAVLAGGHIGGILGIILAVPIAATIKILLEFSLDKINERSAAKS